MKKNVAGNITLGLQTGIMISLFVYGGYRLDLVTGLSPLFLFLGVLVGMGASVYLLLRDLRGGGDDRHDDSDTDDVRWM